MSKEIVFSGVQPSGQITIGNYLGAIKNWINLQEKYTCYFSVVDLHSITVDQVPANLRKNTLDLLAMYLACGIDPEKSTIFIQSHVSTHVELAWILTNLTYMGELNRMTQYKSKKSDKNNNAGLFMYPVLMAADILLYNSSYVPVGEDQEQHLQLARDLANRFNNKYSPTFTVPKEIINTSTAKIMSLQDPTKKMSKSDDNPNSYILMLDKPEDIKRKIRRAVTDSCNKIEYNNEQLGMKNLITIYSSFSGLSIEEIEEKYKGVDYGRFKDDVANSIINVLVPIQEKYYNFIEDKDSLKKIYKNGAIKAQKDSYKVLNKVYRKTGFIQK